MTFSNLGLAEPIVRAVAAEGYVAPTPIQSQSIPHVLAGHDLLSCAQTGTGKTAAFALPILHRLSQARHGKHNGATHRAIRTLILCPTRELAAQINDSFRAYGRNLKLRTTAIFGGVSQFHQVKALKQGVDIVIATPGRLQDLVEQGYVDLRAVEVLVLDEADRMLDMGFIVDIRRIVKMIPAPGAPGGRQTLLFSATMPREIRSLADSILHKPVSVQAAPEGTTVESVSQSVYFVSRNNKPALLAHLLKTGGMARTLVFTQTKHGADRVAKGLVRAGIRAEAIHGNKSQNARIRALNNFRGDSPPVLVATDVASRGIDVDDVTHVINYDIPNVAESYVHRIGRTARAGASGAAITFCDHHERSSLKAIERLTRTQIEIRDDMPDLASLPTNGADRMNGHRDDSRDSRREGRNGRHQRGSHRGASPKHRSKNEARPKQSSRHSSSHDGLARSSHDADRPKARTGFGQRGRSAGRQGKGAGARFASSK